MAETLNEEIILWLGRWADRLRMPKSEVPLFLGKEEVANRIECYPAFGRALMQKPIDMAKVENSGRACWALQGRFEIIRYGEFVSNPDSAAAITRLVAEFPADDAGAARRIDTFMEKCDSLGYRDRKTNNLIPSSAGLLASTMLTAVFPKRFVDYRQTRWKGLADDLNYPLFNTAKPTYGEVLVATGRFAQDICATNAFKASWPDGEPLWTIAGICWHANSKDGASPPPPTVSPDGSYASQLRKSATKADEDGYFEPASLEDEREHKLTEIVQRRGQPGFRSKLIAAYNGCCAVTGCDVVSALEAAHIKPYLGPASNHVSNGLLLRADIHTLFDLNLIGINPESLQVVLAEHLRETYYETLDAQELIVPDDAAQVPSRDALQQRWTMFQEMVTVEAPTR